MVSKLRKFSAIASATFLVACGGGSDSPTAPAVPSVLPSTEAALTAATAFLAKYDALLATSIPTTGAAALALNDGCYLADGRTKAYIVNDFDTDPQSVASRAFGIGSTRTNVKVVADRAITNADGTSRREIDITYDVNYKDGTKNERGNETLISGSSAGAKLPDGTACAASESKSDWRFFGNRQVVNTFVTAYNDRLEGTSLATGLPLSPNVVYSKYIGLGVQDPARVATYATIEGPGLGIGLNYGKSGAFKLLSVRLLRDAPELAGKRGNYVDWLDTNSFQVCSNATLNNFEPAETADCLTNGTYGNTWGYYYSTNAAGLDTSFATMNIKAGDVYTFKVYNDDGWKKVNGQADKTPIATYTRTLDHLPMSAADLAGTGVTADKFARVTSSSKTAAEIATAIRAKTTISADFAWTAPVAMPDARPTALNDVSAFVSGPANTTGVSFWPASRKSDPNYPGALATSMTRNFPAPNPALVVPTYGEISLSYLNRNGNYVRSIYRFQQ
jgi:hypothetical protein